MKPDREHSVSSGLTLFASVATAPRVRMTRNFRHLPGINFCARLTRMSPTKPYRLVRPRVHSEPKVRSHQIGERRIGPNRRVLSHTLSISHSGRTVARGATRRKHRADEYPCADVLNLHAGYQFSFLPPKSLSLLCLKLNSRYGICTSPDKFGLPDAVVQIFWHFTGDFVGNRDTSCA